MNDSLQAGSDTDIEVAVKVMGWITATNADTGGHAIRRPDGQIVSLEEVPKYSSSLAASKEVSDKLSKEHGRPFGFWVDRSLPGSPFVAGFHDKLTAYGSASEPSLAVCRASLTLVERVQRYGNYGDEQK